MLDGELVRQELNKTFQTLKYHNLLSVLRLGLGQSVQRSQLLCLWGSVLGACSIIHNHHNLVCEIGRGSGQLWQVPLPDVRNSLLKRPNHLQLGEIRVSLLKNLKKTL